MKSGEVFRNCGGLLSLFISQSVTIQTKNLCQYFHWLVQFLYFYKIVLDIFLTLNLGVMPTNGFGQTMLVNWRILPARSTRKNGVLCRTRLCSNSRQYSSVCHIGIEYTMWGLLAYFCNATEVGELTWGHAR